MIQRTLRKTTPAPLTRVWVTGGFWAERMATNRAVTLPIEYTQCKKTGRLDAWDLTWKPGEKNKPHIFWDSDVAKWIEAACYSLTQYDDLALRKKVEAVVDRIEAAQQPDGYLNVHFTVVEPEKRWTNLRDCHELYCAGHLMEAAVAHYHATGSPRLLDVLCRYADHIDRTFGPDRGQKKGYPGHEEIELALVKLFHATGVERYLELATFFVDQRGRRPHYYDKEAKARGDDPKTFWAGTYEYNQSHLPVREQSEVVGHAVRAMYLYSGMADVAAETGDKTLLAACKRLWANVTGTRMYVTGGIGPTGRNEGFTTDYDLPNESAYAETCAAIGLVFWAHRMLGLDPRGAYADVMERALYNGVLSGVSLDGAHFFYGNPLASYPAPQRPKRSRRRKGPDVGSPHVRPEWFGCACCPPNLARLLSSLPAYLYSEGTRQACVHLYAASRAELHIGRRRVVLEQKTQYPYREKVRLTIRPDKPAAFTLALRIPGWCRGAKATVNGKAVSVAKNVRKGYLRLRRQWKKDDRVELTLPMPVELIEAHPAVRQDAGRVAIQRGPLVYCLEETDNGTDLADLSLPAGAKLRAKFEPNTLGGTMVVTGRARRRDRQAWKTALYQPAPTKRCSVGIKAVPYFLWANRGPGEMVVWIQQDR